MKPKIVGLVDVGERLPLNLRKLAKILNGLQSSFRFEVGRPITADVLGKADVLFKWFEVPRLWKLLRDVKADDHAYVIGITSCRLTHTEELKQYADPEPDYFSRGDQNSVAMISVNEVVLRYNSPGKDIYQYTAFCVCAELLGLHTEEKLFHDENPRCVFHECGDRDAFRTSMEAGLICHPCHAALNAANVPDAVVEDVKKVFAWCRRNNWAYVVRRTLEDPVVMLFLGAGVGWSSSIFLDRSQWPAVSVGVVLPLCATIYLKRRG